MPKRIRSGSSAWLAVVLPILSASTAVAPAQAAPPISCQAINSTGIISGSIPSPACYETINPGDIFEIDFTNAFLNNPSAFAPANTFSLQIANINTVPSVLSFEDVELLITGTFNPPLGGPSQTFSTPTAISIWQASGQTGQGISGYTTNGTGTDFGLGTAFKSANFTLTSPQTPAFGTSTAGLINTIPISLTAAGVTSFTSARIRGKLSSASNLSANEFSAGLGIFTSNNPATQPPNLIYGNAFNAVPGPLPLVGAGAAFGWSRRLRRRVAAAKAV